MTRALLLVVVTILPSCERGMDRDARVAPLEQSSLFADGRASRPPVPGTVPVEQHDTAAVEDLRRGAERYVIFCSPCHGAEGRGDGPVVKHGFPAAPSLVSGHGAHHSEDYMYDVITNGVGAMPAYGSRISPADRRAIIRYTEHLHQRASDD